MSADDVFCPDCGFPQRGTEAEQRRFVVEKRKERATLEDHRDMVRKARNYLLITALLNMVSFISNEPVVLIVGAIISGIFVGLSFWAARQAYPALLTALLTYISIQLFFALFDAMYLLSGLLWKIVIVGTLIFALRSARELQKKAADGKPSGNTA